MKIVLYKENNFLGKLIQFFSRGPYVHCSIILPDNSVIDARPFKGVILHNNLQETLNKYSKIEIFEIFTTAREEEIIWDFLIKQLGKKYDWWSIFGFILFTSKQGRKNYNRWFCSELLYAAFQRANVILLNNIEAWKVTPTMLSYSDKLIPID